MMEKRKITCIGCPVGCELDAAIGNDGKIEISNNLCKIGAEYGVKECTNPTRILTTSIAVERKNGETAMLSVKTSSGIPKGKIFECLQIIKGTRLTDDSVINVSDVVIPNILGLGVDVVATRRFF